MRRPSLRNLSISALLLVFALALGACGSFEVGLERETPPADRPAARATSPAATPATPRRTGQADGVGGGVPSSPTARTTATPAADGGAPAPASTPTEAATPTESPVMPTATAAPEPTGAITPEPEPAATLAPVTTPEANGATAEQMYEDLLARFDAPALPPDRTPEQVYRQRLGRYAEDYAACARRAERSGQKCAKPKSLGDRELRERINVELILDASGSMQAEVGGERKIDIAKRVLKDFIRTLPPDANVALRVYGHVGSNSEADRARSCAGSELVYPFEPLDEARFAAAIDSFEARGWTPVAGSLDKARRDFAGLDPRNNSNFVYLVSDGIETCGGDPVAAARRLAAADIRAEVNIVGFDVDPAAARQLRRAAEAGGGGYSDASNAAELDEVFRENYDWTAWTSYYACVYNKAWGEYNEIYAAVWSNYNCLYDKAWGEYNDMYDAAWGEYNTVYNREWALYNSIYKEVYGNEPRYEEQRDEILELAKVRRDGSIERAKAQRDHTVRTAQGKRDGLLDPAKSKRDRVLEAAQQEREDALDQAERDRDENIDE